MNLILVVILVNDNEMTSILNELRPFIRSEVENILKNYMKITTATVISVSSGVATIRLPYAESDGSQDFSANIITSQTISQGDVVNIAYWCNLSTAIVLGK